MSCQVSRKDFSFGVKGSFFCESSADRSMHVLPRGILLNPLQRFAMVDDVKTGETGLLWC